MIKRTIEISRRAAHLTVQHRQLLLISKDEDRSEMARIPCEDIGVLLVDHPQTTYTHSALATLLEQNAAVVLCGRNHLPAGLLLPLSEHTKVVWRIRSQLSASKPLQKRLWQQIVRAKITAQAEVLGRANAKATFLMALVRQVRSGDPSNVEARAAKAYWDALFPDECFRRNQDGEGINSLLNYGYAVVRAAVARAIVAAGLFPVIGIHHRHRGNAFCLADDLVEPLRPMVDVVVRGLVEARTVELTPESKRSLLEILAADVECADQRGPMMVTLHRYVATLVQCYEGTAQSLQIPVRSA